MPHTLYCVQAGRAKKLTSIHVYFDNDQAGYAVQNALTLKAMVFG